jgi:hypothetical protein
MAPVAKRNFCRRHDHGMSGPKADGTGKDSDDDDEDDDNDDDNEKNKMDESERTVDAVDEWNGKDHVGDKRKRRTPDDADGSVTSTLDTSDVGCRRKGNRNSVSSKRRALWSDLLARRPRTKDPRNLSSWLNEVLTVSDLDFPVDTDTPIGIPSEIDPDPIQSKILGLGNDPGNKNNDAMVGTDVGRHDAAETGPTNQRKEAKKKGGGKRRRETIKSTHRDSSAQPPTSQDGHRESWGDYDFDPNLAGSFADWRGRKKPTKKGSSSLRK